MKSQSTNSNLIQFWRQRGEVAGRTIGRKINGHGLSVFEYEIDRRGDLYSAYMTLSDDGRVIAEQAYLAGFESMLVEEDQS